LISAAFTLYGFDDQERKPGLCENVFLNFEIQILYLQF